MIYFKNILILVTIFTLTNWVVPVTSNDEVIGKKQFFYINIIIIYYIFRHYKFLMC